MARLYMAYLGGQMEKGRIGEDHEVVIVAAEDEVAAKQLAKKKWHGAGSGHVDMLVKIEQVDGYKVSLTENTGDDKVEINDNWKSLNSP